MNMHGIVAGAVGAINPLITASVQISTGYSTSSDGNQVPSYATPVNYQVQVQALAFKDIQQLDALNIQGERRAVYVPAQLAGVIRVDQKGGDLLTFAEYPGGPSHTWLVAVVLETWPDWVKVAVTLQDS